MKIVFKGIEKSEQPPSKEAALLEEGKLYEAANDSTNVNGVLHYKVTVENGQDILCPEEWFFNLTLAIKEHSAQTGVIGAPPFIGDRVTIAVNVIPERFDDTTEYVLTSPVEYAEEVVPRWYWFKTMSGIRYIAYGDPDFEVELFS